MPIDFSSPSNHQTYASRSADASWFDQMRDVLQGQIPERVADIGCGGGIYTRAWREFGAHTVVGIDMSAPQIALAQAETADAAITWAVANAYATSLADASQDLVFNRAVIHHLQDHPAAMAEAYRILAPGGLMIVQDRTIEDVLQPESPQHFRALFFREYPGLLETEYQRRPVHNTFTQVLSDAGFSDIQSVSFWETRRTYRNADELRVDLLARTGRSILHDLTDEELHHLTDTILANATGHFPLAESDRWTMWTARKPGQ